MQLTACAICSIAGREPDSITECQQTLIYWLGTWDMDEHAYAHTCSAEEPPGICECEVLPMND